MKKLREWFFPEEVDTDFVRPYSHVEFIQRRRIRWDRLVAIFLFLVLATVVGAWV